MSDIIIVSQPTDELSKAFEQYLVSLGMPYQHFNFYELSKQITIEQEAKKLCIYPFSSLLLRPLPRLESASDEEVRFCWSEAFAAVWSFAAMTSKPVVNRPNEWGWGCSVSSSAAITELRMTGTIEMQESFWHILPPNEKLQMFHQDLTTWETIENPNGESYFRSRSMPKCVGWEKVVVVDSEAFRTTAADLGEINLELKSINLVSKIGLKFATVNWGIPYNCAPPILARINPFPTLLDCSTVWLEVRKSLLKFLLAK